MKYKVIQTFKDKDTMKLYEVGSTYETDNKERANDLIEKGYITTIKTRKKEAE